MSNIHIANLRVVLDAITEAEDSGHSGLDYGDTTPTKLRGNAFLLFSGVDMVRISTISQMIMEHETMLMPVGANSALTLIIAVINKNRKILQDA